MTTDLPTGAVERGLRTELLPGSVAETALHLLAAFTLLWISVSSFVISMPLGLAVTFALTLALVTFRPQAAPMVIVTAFMFQNVIIATFTPMVPNDQAFDSLRGANFVVLMTAYGAFLLATFQSRLRHVTGLRPWLIAGLGVLAMICVYLALGAVAGEPRDAIVYFRNTVSPLACFHVALVAASLYRVRLDRALAWLGAAAIVYGYGELLFTMDFLHIFNGDLYIERQIRRQIETGEWEKRLQETGFVLRGLADVMTTDFFNTPFFRDILPPVFRIGGPNFHPISFAYALAIISIWQIFRGRWLLPLFALPLLLVIGSKGAMVMYGLALAVFVGMRLLRARQVLVLFLLASVAWLSLAIVIGLRGGDYHVLGFVSGLAEFVQNPIGHGLGLGGNLSSTSEHLDWGDAQATGATSIPVESAVGVMLYQMGVGALVFFAFLFALAATSRRLFLRTGDSAFLFGFVVTTAIACNAVLQEEAFYSPLALGFCLLLLGTTLGSYWRQNASTR